jgi:hypothetical protein
MLERLVVLPQAPFTAGLLGKTIHFQIQIQMLHCFKAYIFLQDTLEQIIDQCMWSKFTGENQIHSTNGGRWSYGNEYAEGWFYSVNGNNKRDVDGLPDSVDANRTVHLAFDTYGNVTGVAHDFQLQPDGTTKDVAAKN